MLKLNGAWLCGLSSVPQGSGLSRLRSSTVLVRENSGMCMSSQKLEFTSIDWVSLSSDDYMSLSWLSFAYLSSLEGTTS